MHWIRDLLHPPRPFSLEQIVGFGMMLAAAVSTLRPNSPVFVWIEQTYDVAHVGLFILGALGVCGWILAWQRSTSMAVYRLLTLPVVFYALLSNWWVLATGGGTLLPAVEIYCLWLALQVIHTQRGVVRRWINP